MPEQGYQKADGGYQPVSETTPAPTKNLAALEAGLDSVTTVPTGAPNVAMKQVALNASTPTAIVNVRDTRRYVDIKNIGSVDVYLSEGTPTSGNSWVLAAGQEKRFDTTAAINGLSASVTPSVSVAEVYD